MNKGLVSIIMPYFKKEKFFYKSFNSAYKQNYKKKEIIIIYDDKNRDELNFVKKQFQKKKM